jgi:hypothetical protein
MEVVGGVSMHLRGQATATSAPGLLSARPEARLDEGGTGLKLLVTSLGGKKGTRPVCGETSMPVKRRPDTSASGAALRSPATTDIHVQFPIPTF